MNAGRVVVAWPLVILTWPAGRQVAVAWSTNAIPVAENGEVTSVVRIVDRSGRIRIRQIEENANEARTRQLRHPMEPNFRLLERMSYRFRYGNRMRHEPADRRRQPHGYDKRTLDVFITETRHVERVTNRITPRRQYGIEISGQRMRVLPLPLVPNTIDVDVNGPKDRIVRGSQVAQHVAILWLRSEVI